MIKTPLSTVLGGAFWTPGATVIGDAKLSFEIVMKKLFTNGEQGFAYDPNDLTTLYQDAAGTIPVAAQGQPVGLLLDKSKILELGGELLINTTFQEDYKNWTKASPIYFNTLDAVSGSAVLEIKNATASGTGGLDQTIQTIPGKWYIFSCDIQCPTTNAALVRVESLGLGGSPVFGNGKSQVVFKAPSSTTVVRLAVSLANEQVGQKYYFASPTVRELKGNHAYQSTSAARPILQDAPRRIDFDAVDDKLTTNLPEQLTGCTVIRSVPNVGTHILTNQTVPTPYNDNIDNCGLIVINRALTPSETSAITAEFNKRAGV